MKPQSWPSGAGSSSKTATTSSSFLSSTYKKVIPVKLLSVILIYSCCAQRTESCLFHFILREIRDTGYFNNALPYFLKYALLPFATLSYIGTQKIPVFLLSLHSSFEASTTAESVHVENSFFFDHFSFNSFVYMNSDARFLFSIWRFRQNLGCKHGYFYWRRYSPLLIVKW